MNGRLTSCSALAVGAIALAGCFPYRETYRPMISGRVVDEKGAPLPAVSVEACSDGSWSDLKGCPRRGTATTAMDGTFEFKSVKETDMCCFGEAPLPRTIVSVCLPDGRVGGAHVSGIAPVWVTVPVGSPETLSPSKGGRYSWGLNEAKAEVTRRCADPSNAGKAPPSSPGDPPR